MIAFGQNGEAIRPEQGYPARLLFPGWEGNANIKWLRRLELSNAPFMTREETSKYTDPLPDCTARMFSFEMDAKSLITYPTFPQTLDPGWREIEGIAWTGRGKITRVDVSTDGGQTWAPAELQEPILPLAHVRFRFPWTYNGGEATLMSRAVDETGYVQPTTEPVDRRPWGRDAVPLQQHPRLEGRRRRSDHVRGGVSGMRNTGQRLILLGVWAAATLLIGGSVQAQQTPPAQPAPNVPQQFGFGRAATADEIGAWDIDVKPDGTGLPAGGGTVSDGEAVYAQKCAGCHGPTGREGPMDRLVEPATDDFAFGRDPSLVRTVGNYWPYATTLFDFINRAMPLPEPGSLEADEVYSLVAWILHENEIIAADATMDAQSLPTVVMPARDRFVEDTRRGGPEVR